MCEKCPFYVERFVGLILEYVREMILQNKNAIPFAFFPLNVGLTYENARLIEWSNGFMCRIKEEFI